MIPQKADRMPASGRQIQKEKTKILGQQCVGIGADRVEGHIAEVEQASQSDDDVETPAEHHIGQD